MAIRRILLILSLLLLLPFTASAAPSSFRAAQSLVAASSSPGNAYAVGASVVLTAPIAGDLSAFGGSVVSAAPVAGDGLIFAGSIVSRAPVAGDMRALGGTIEITKPINGDLVAGGFSISDSSLIGGTVLVVADNVTLGGGANGPVTIYGNNVALAGEFMGDVTIAAWGRVALAPGTVIQGKLSYEAPELALIPTSAKIIGGVQYRNPSYLPDVGTSRILALLSIGFFIIARIVGALILAGLLAGLFPIFAERMIVRISKSRNRSRLLTFFLGFAVLVATPIVIALLTLTFVGAGLAILLIILYALLVALSFLYAGILVGGFLMRRLRKRTTVRWLDGVIGMVILSLATLIPFVGLIALAILGLFVAGTLLQVFFQFAFPHEDIS